MALLLIPSRGWGGRYNGVFYEWLPSWWTESAVYEWLDTAGAWLVPWHLHLSAAFLEWAAFHRLIVATPKHRKLWRQLRLSTFVLHGLAFFGTFFVLDGGYSFRAVSGMTAVAASVLAVVALTAARLHLRGRGRGRTIAETEKTHESRM